jgi:hypothetical protein
MSKKTVEYYVVTAFDPTLLAKRVNDYLQNDWHLFGSMDTAVSEEYTCFMQPMIKYEEDKQRLTIF